MRSGRGLSARDLFGPVPRAVKAVTFVGFLALWLLAMITMLTGPSGQPTTQDGHYYLDNHGQLTEVSHEEYDEALGQSARLFASGSTIFYGFAFVLSRWGRAPDRETIGVPF